MPNWCYNHVTLTNEDKSKIDALHAVMQETNEDGREIGLIFQHLRPRPESEENWYNWNIENWGTKWDASFGHCDRYDDNSIFFTFDSAWSPPIALYEYLTENGWDVDAVYQEEGMGYIGSFKDGDDDCYEYDITDRPSIEALPEELIEFGDLITRHEEWVEENEEEDD